MAERPIWRGTLRLALVSCPVALYSARHERAQLRFHFINPETGHRVRMVTVDAETDQEVTRRDLVRGYEYKKDHYVLMDEEDFENARIESSSSLKLDKFVPADSIDAVFFDSSYYVVPDGDENADVYVVLRDAIAQSGCMALTRVVIARREHAAGIVPMDNGLVLHTLHEQRDLHDAHRLFEQVPPVKPDSEMVKLAMQLIGRQSARFEPSDMEDRYEARLRQVIEAKLHGEGIAPEAEARNEESNVIDLMAALKKSLGQAPEQKGVRPAKSAARPSKPKRPARKQTATRGKAPARKRA